jgi:hypothetical protein
MAPSELERLATIESAVSAIHEDLVAQREAGKADHSRLRQVEISLSGILEVQKETIRQQELALQRMNVRLQRMSVSIAAGGLAIGIAVALTGH